MLSREDSRRLAQLERQLRREDPEFCARMAGGGGSERRRVPLSLILAGTALWVTVLILAVAGWWIAAAVTGLWATVMICVLAHRFRSNRRRADRENPSW